MLKQKKALLSGRPPGPKGTLIGGMAYKFGDGLLDFFLETARTYGPLASGRIGPRRFLLASDPALIEQVLVRDAKHYTKHFGLRAFIPALGNGLVSSEGAYWRGQRKLIQPTFIPSRVRSYAPVMTKITKDALEQWSDGDELMINTEFSSLTSQIALRTLFDLVDDSDRQEFTETLKLAFDIMTERLRRVLKAPLWLPTPENIRLKRAIADLDETVLGFIAAGRARDEPGDDLLSRLLAATRDDGSHMSDRELRDETMTLYLAGHETTALALTWTWVLLSRHPEVEDKLVDEWARVLRGRTPELEDMPNLPYTHAVLSESMRLYPPAYVIGREATTDLELGGYRVKRGYTVFVSQWVNHRDPRYFPDPERFHPERWEDNLAKRIPKFAYFPFGGGQRICVGNTFALLEAAIILAAVGQRFRFRIDDDAELGFKPQITLMPVAPIPVTLEAR